MSELPDKKRQRLASEIFEPVYANGKSGNAWPRKTAAMLYQMIRQQRDREQSSMPKTDSAD